MEGHQTSDSDLGATEVRPRKPIAGFAGTPGGGAVWLDNGQPLTACPNCHGAMPVRVWLSLAECARCGTSVRLTAAQEEQALAVLRQPAAASANPTAPVAIPATSRAATKSVEAVTIDLPPLDPRPVVAEPRPDRPFPQPAAKAAHTSTNIEPQSVDDEEPVDRLASAGRFFICWLVSAVLHMVLVLMLGRWLLEKESRAGPIVLAATVSDRVGDEHVEQVELPSEQPLADDDMVSLPDLPTTEADPELVAAVTTVEQPSGDLLTNAELNKLPIGAPSPGQVLAGRDPALRSQLVASEGGTTQSEAAVARALAWLVRHQDADGRWSLNRFDAAGDCRGRCRDLGVESDTAATALALLPFLGAGQTQLRGDHTRTVARGLRALMDLQRADGDLRGEGNGNMYAHGQATIALCEAFALTQAENLRDPAQRAVNFIVSAQHEEGGWRYRPGEPGDLSVVGWQMMALRSAQMAYLKVPQETFLKATRFLNSVQQSPSLGLYGYMPGAGPSPVMTAEGLLCRQYSGWRHNHPVLLHGVRWLEQNQLPQPGQANMYFWYYGTQVMHHMGGPAWEKWNDAMRDLLISKQAVAGHEAGSWTPFGAHDPQGGRLYTTALAACTLEVYYRHLPLYRGAASNQPATGTATPRGKR